MASFSAPRYQSSKADGAIAKGKAVKVGTDAQHVAKATAATDKIIGICQNDPTVAEDVCEVALPGGGAKALLGGTVSAGDLLTADTNGKWIATTSANDRVGCVALEDGVAGDLIAVEVQLSNV